jgi:hypothetical protein
MEEHPMGVTTVVDPPVSGEPELEIAEYLRALLVGGF